MKRYVVLGTVFAMLAVGASPGFAALKWSTNDGGQQVWLTADAFDVQSGYIADAAVPPANTLSGKAYNFPGPPDSPPANQQNSFVQYSIPKSALPASFDLSGAWTFWCRSSQSVTSVTSVDSDWLLVNGDPGDLNMSNPAEADWWAAVLVSPGQGAPSVDRFLNEVGQTGNFYGYNFGWFSEANLGVNIPRVKNIAVIDDKVTFRIYEREQAAANALIDVLVLANNSAYQPTDAAFQAAVPEPASLALLGMAGVATLVLRRRR